MPPNLKIALVSLALFLLLVLSGFLVHHEKLRFHPLCVFDPESLIQVCLPVPGDNHARTNAHRKSEGSR